MLVVPISLLLEHIETLHESTSRAATARSRIERFRMNAVGGTHLVYRALKNGLQAIHGIVCSVAPRIGGKFTRSFDLLEKVGARRRNPLRYNRSGAELMNRRTFRVHVSRIRVAGVLCSLPGAGYSNSGVVVPDWRDPLELGSRHCAAGGGHFRAFAPVIAAGRRFYPELGA